MPQLRKRDPGPIKSAMRTLALLEHFRRTKVSASVAELSSALSMPQSSTSVLLKTLVSLNYLEYNAATRKFFPGYRVALLGDWIQSVRFGDQRVTEIMETLQAETGETVILGQQVGAAMQYLHVVPASYRIQLMVYAGEMRMMSRTALGQILLSSKSNSQIRAIVRRNNSDQSKVSPDFRETAFMQEIEAIRQRGYSETKGRTTAGASTIGMLVPMLGNHSLLAIGVGGPLDRIEAKRRDIINTMRRRLAAG